MTIRDKRFVEVKAVALGCLLLGAYSPFAQAADVRCKQLSLELSGSFDDSASEYVLPVPVEALGESDSAVNLRLTRKAPGTWEVGLQSSLKNDDVSKVSVVSVAVLRLSDSESPTDWQSFGFQPKSSATMVAQSAIAVSIKNVKRGTTQSGPVLSTTGIVDRNCFVQGQLDTKNEVNGGNDLKYLYGIKDVAEGVNWEPPEKAAASN